MEGIPPARASDNEDVVWALETAESLWKRNARVDAIVWLRRAAQEAADSGDDDRAAALMVEAATLTDTLARASAHMRAAVPSSRPPPADADDVDALLATADEQTQEVEAFHESDFPAAAGDLPTPVPPGSAPVDDASFAPSTDRRNPGALETDGPDDEGIPIDDVAGITRMGPDALSLMDLADVEALGEASADQREGLVRAATVLLCSAEVEVPSFGLALVLEGEVDASLEQDGPTVDRFGPGSVICTHTGLEIATGVRFLATTDDTSLALWPRAALRQALLEVPSIEARLRAEGDRLRAWARVAASPLASHLHEDVRLRLTRRLTARTLAPAADLVLAGQAVPGVLLVGEGTVTIDDARATVVRPGEFVFPEATLTAARADATARAGRDGAIVLCADRHTTQELCATEPFLIELLAAAC
jgi:CRP-like cAMP-binding protein